ncbi:TetR/AcrR family transcriptional regulator [Amycolatopsis panacis]|uniref:TetR/AcrR family transcriptional regulator n=1 Tax=Amycolatopsis panacis TaxID=2340917 RepID=A0A419I6K8_9PSEU|nr:TetR/AcrR family transcriptional regulator [Amycolatopsis panacis]RJQ87065.1 TetR/AcrR family transcriptional regulator [Amycolatopsis panacis]
MSTPELHRRPTARQRALLAELEAVFLAEGFAGFTLDDLAARLRCSKSTLYALAPSKEQLAVKVVAHYFRGAAQRIEERIAGISDARELIGEYLAGVAENLNRASPAFMTDIAEFAPARDTYQLNSRAAARRIRAFIDQGVAGGVFRDVQARLVAEMAGLIVEGIQTGVLARRTDVSDAEAFTALGELLLGGLTKQD